MASGRRGGKGVGGGTICEVDDLHLRTHLTSTMSFWRLLGELWLPGQSNSSYPLGQGN